MALIEILPRRQQKKCHRSRRRRDVAYLEENNASAKSTHRLKMYNISRSFRPIKQRALLRRRPVSAADYFWRMKA